MRKRKMVALISAGCMLMGITASAGNLTTGISGEGTAVVSIESNLVNARTEKGKPGDNYYRYVSAEAKVQMQSGQWIIVSDVSSTYQGIASVVFSGIRDAEYVRSTHQVDGGVPQTFMIYK